MTTIDTAAPRCKLIPTSQTISVLPTTTAHVYTHIHPILVLTLYYVFFPSLVADPVSTLKKALAPLAHLQIIYCVVCLPPFAASPSSKAEAPKTQKKKRVQFAHTAKGPATKPTTIASRLIPAIYSLVLSLLLSTPLLTVMMILFGASINSYLWHTLLCATHMSILGVLPLFYTRGVDSRMWREIAGACLPFDEVWGALVGTVLGAWLGAVPIPLDWDRDWQKWPVTIVTGAYAGWFAFRFVGEYLLRGKRIEFD